MSYRKIAEWIKSKWDISLSHVRVRQIIKQRLRDGDFTVLVLVTPQGYHHGAPPA